MARNNNQTNAFIKWVVIAVDLLILNGLLFLFRWLHPVMSAWPTDRVEIFWVVCNLAMILSQWKFSTIIHLRLISGGDILRRVISLVILQTIIAYLVMKAVDIQLTVGWMLVSIGLYEVVILIVARLLERILVKSFRQMGRNTRMVTFVGNDPELDLLYEKLAHNPTLGYNVRGYYGEPREPNAKNKASSLRHLGTVEELMDAIGHNRELNLGEEVYACMHRKDREKLWALSAYCDQHIVRFYYVPSSVEKLGMRLKRELFDDLELFTTYEIPLENPVNQFLKRFFDIVMSVVALLFCVPLLPVVAFIIRMQSPGPIFFRQERTGINGKNFVCLKFRSMHVNVDADRLQATEDDPRKFPFGNLMRKYNIDELPQFWNVLLGHMSIVGPRPHMLLHTEFYSNKIGKYMVRHFVKPGITGWAQVTGFRGETKEMWQMKERVKRDIWYIENWSIWLDLRIIWLTLKSVFVHDKNAY